MRGPTQRRASWSCRWRRLQSPGEADALYGTGLEGSEELTGLGDAARLHPDYFVDGAEISVVFGDRGPGTLAQWLRPVLVDVLLQEPTSRDTVKKGSRALSPAPLFLPLVQGGFSARPPYGDSQNPSSFCSKCTMAAMLPGGVKV